MSTRTTSLICVLPYIPYHSYDPGHMLLFRSADLWHKVMAWKPAVMTPEMSVTPGRMSLVFFTPGYTLQSAAHQASGTGIRTGNETLRLLREDKKTQSERRPPRRKRTETGNGKEGETDGLEDAS
jgi:hypothetical protein